MANNLDIQGLSDIFGIPNYLEDSSVDSVKNYLKDSTDDSVKSVFSGIVEDKLEEKCEEIAVIETTAQEVMEVQQPVQSVQEIKKVSDTNLYCSDEFKKLITTAQSMLDTAKYLVESSPDAKNVMAASNLVASLSKVISDFSRIQIEKMKVDATLEIANKKLESQKMALELKKRSPGTPDNPVSPIQVNYNFAPDKILKELAQANQAKV